MKIKMFYPAGILPPLYAHNGIPGTYLDTDFYPIPVVFRCELTSLSNNIIVIHHGSQTKANQTFVKICMDNVSCNECRFCCWLCLLERAQGPPAVGTPDSGWQKTNKIWWTEPAAVSRPGIHMTSVSSVSSVTTRQYKIIPLLSRTHSSHQHRQLIQEQLENCPQNGTSNGVVERG